MNLKYGTCKDNKKSKKVEMCYFVWSLWRTGDASKLGMTPGILGINRKLIKRAFVIFHLNWHNTMTRGFIELGAKRPD